MAHCMIGRKIPVRPHSILRRSRPFSDTCRFGPSSTPVLAEFMAKDRTYTSFRPLSSEVYAIQRPSEETDPANSRNGVARNGNGFRFPSSGSTECPASFLCLRCYRSESVHRVSTLPVERIRQISTGARHPSCHLRLSYRCRLGTKNDGPPIWRIDRRYVIVRATRESGRGASGTEVEEHYVRCSFYPLARHCMFPVGRNRHALVIAGDADLRQSVAKSVIPGQLNIRAARPKYQDVVFRNRKTTVNAAVIADMVGDYLRLPCQSQSTVIKRLRHQRRIAQEEKIADVRVFRRDVDWREPGLQQGRAALLFRLGINRSDIDGAGLVDAASMIDEMSAVGQETWASNGSPVVTG